MRIAALASLPLWIHFETILALESLPQEKSEQSLFQILGCHVVPGFCASSHTQCHNQDCGKRNIVDYIHYIVAVVLQKKQICKLLIITWHCGWIWLLPAFPSPSTIWCDNYLPAFICFHIIYQQLQRLALMRFNQGKEVFWLLEI